MSNTLNIELVEFKIAKSNVPASYALYIYDNYADTLCCTFPTYEELLKEFPTRLSVLFYISGTEKFVDTITVEGSEVTLDTVSYISFAGFPDSYESDDSFTITEV